MPSGWSADSRCRSSLRRRKARALPKPKRSGSVAGSTSSSCAAVTKGVDERVRACVTEEISIGDYILSGGELPALVIVDALARLVPGVVGDEQSVAEDSFSRGLLDFPHYTRPAEVRALKVPDVLLSGHHAEIRRWRKRVAVSRTLERRPDLLSGASLDDDEREVLREIVARRDKGVGDGRD